MKRGGGKIEPGSVVINAPERLNGDREAGFALGVYGRWCPVCSARRADRVCSRCGGPTI